MKETSVNNDLVAAIGTLKAEHPYWGYRKVWAYLKYRRGLPVNRKRIYRLMGEHGFLVKQNQKLRATRTLPKSKPRADKPNHIWGIDMTKVITACGWIYLVVVLDWYTKKIVGWNVAANARTAQWLEALNMAANRQYPDGIKDAESRPKLVSDNGSQPTSEAFMKECAELKIEQIFTSYNNPKGNADTERVIRTIKEDLVWPNEWNNYYEFLDALEEWCFKYNTDFPHSALKYKTPYQFEQIWSQNYLKLTA
jgi:transposase InsO family protein